MPYDATPLTTLTPFASIDLSAAERAARAELATARMELALCRPDRREAAAERIAVAMDTHRQAAQSLSETGERLTQWEAEREAYLRGVRS